VSVVGRFITLEGGEGVGKSTQLKRLAAALRGRGLDVVETREPGGSPGAEAIRALLLEGEEERWTPDAEALLFAAARADHVARTIAPALQAGQWVLCDRFIDSSLAYQGIGAGLGLARIRSLHEAGANGFLPDRTLLLQLPSRTSAARTRARDGMHSDRIGGRGEDYHDRVAAAFAALAEEDPARLRTIDASGSVEEVTARLLAAVDDLL
jgi:dTMP kinase